ncbi:hypothetical protein CHL67_01910 [Prosthecochloris sp. GSB1]|uniref:hypothetical protein n=1 Tax=Prosthecochloris sp. GSB1 TaxID=281093 RepID=UPI000B8CA4A9|nr:hypothetical protein [Prosthecochloris sp. GSB1]ASQ89839.1 hypothetical protein CHL67_01910 [Prosthecochloris sp. GSB1]
MTDERGAQGNPVLDEKKTKKNVHSFVESAFTGRGRRWLAAIALWATAESGKAESTIMSLSIRLLH